MRLAHMLFLSTFGSQIHLCISFLLIQFSLKSRTSHLSAESSPQDGIATAADVEAFQEREALKLSLRFLAQDTQRGFRASRGQIGEMNEILSQLETRNPTKEPASAYYTISTNSLTEKNDNEADISGKWTLVYTDAPDITSLDLSMPSSMFPTLPQASKLGRIGQFCDSKEGTISNVIEWLRPDWAQDMIPNSSNTIPRVLQKVVCAATSNPKFPTIVNLQLVGVELVGISERDGDDDSSNMFPSFSSLIEKGPAALLAKQPIRLRGPLKVPFGKFEIKYLDDDMRIIKTGQGFYAVNVREPDAWF